MKTKTLFQFGIPTMLCLFLSCQKDDGNLGLCIAPPCGQFTRHSINITVLNSTAKDIDNVAVYIDGNRIEIDSTGWDMSNGQFFTCWQVIPSIDNSTLIELEYQSEGRIVRSVLNTISTLDKLIVINILKNKALLENYKTCSSFI